MSDYVMLYNYSLNDARHLGEVDKWRESHWANVNCARAIEKAITENFNDNTLNTDCVKSIIDEYGFDRLNFILRYTLKNSQEDLRYSEANRKWGASLYSPNSNMRQEYYVNSHPALLNGFIDEARKVWNDMHLWNSSHCIDEAGLDYEDRILVISPSSLKDEYKTPEDQLFKATGGFGCSPTAIGRTVYGFFIKDNEEACFGRSDFIGVMKDEFIPNWVKEKLNISEDSTEPVEDGGMSMS